MSGSLQTETTVVFRTVSQSVHPLGLEAKPWTGTRATDTEPTALHQTIKDKLATTKALEMLVCFAYYLSFVSPLYSPLYSGAKLKWHRNLVC